MLIKIRNLGDQPSRNRRQSIADLKYNKPQMHLRSTDTRQLSFQENSIPDFYRISTSPSPSSGRGSPRITLVKISLLISGEICACGRARMTSNRASFWSGVRSAPYLRVKSNIHE
jgi:hypothetical protein